MEYRPTLRTVFRRADDIKYYTATDDGPLSTLNTVSPTLKTLLTTRLILRNADTIRRSLGQATAIWTSLCPQPSIYLHNVFALFLTGS